MDHNDIGLAAALQKEASVANLAKFVGRTLAAGKGMATASRLARPAAQAGISASLRQNPGFMKRLMDALKARDPRRLDRAFRQENTKRPVYDPSKPVSADNPLRIPYNYSFPYNGKPVTSTPVREVIPSPEEGALRTLYNRPDLIPPPEVVPAPRWIPGNGMTLPPPEL